MYHGDEDIASDGYHKYKVTDYRVHTQKKKCIMS